MLAVCSPFALGQAMPGATRLLDLQAGGTFTFAYPDYTPQDALGFGLYADADFTPHWGAEVDFHLVDILQHAPAKEWTFGYGARYHRTYGRYNPYLKGLAGYGAFDSSKTFYQLGASPHYNMLTFGAGVDTSISSRLSVRVGMEYQHWFTGGAKGLPGVGGPDPSDPTGPGYSTYLPHGLTPILYEVGISYHFTGGNDIQ